ncbi:MAG TPA: formate dehydrogenase accessory protein FdhE [Burkholderiales bacterium]|nr:formate dehydrogenase accessory protein FdhE [Burkholderiales bacterium]
MTQRILDPHEIQARPASEIPFIRLPQRGSVFADRAARLEQLAQGHAMQDYLGFIAKVAHAQDRMLGEMPPLALPPAEFLSRSRERGMPPLDPNALKRDPLWCDFLRRMLRYLEPQTGGMVNGVVRRLDAERDEFYEAQASKLLAGISLGLDLATAPLIGAGLQVVWVHLVTTLGVDAFRPIDVPSICPACGSRPVASVTRSGGAENGQRFLHCSLCSTEWHMVRIKCTSCESTKGIEYLAVEGGTEAVKAETCDECGTYLKILYVERDPRVEATADDLASIALDLLVADTGKLRSGQNLMLIHGDSEE